MAKYVCNVCGYIFDESIGIPDKGIPANTKFSDLPDDWTCPICGASKSDFSLMEEENKKEEITEQVEELDDSEKKLSIGELSALCFNLARACEKQYKDEESEQFKILAEYFNKITPKESNSNVENLSNLLSEDLSTTYPNAEQIAKNNKDRGALRAITWSKKVSTMLNSLLTSYKTKGAEMLKGKTVWVCTICGFVYIGNDLPPICPVCKVPNFKFEKIGGIA